MNMVTFAGVKKEAVDTPVPRTVIKLQMETNLFAEHRKRPGNHVEFESLLKKKIKRRYIFRLVLSI